MGTRHGLFALTAASMLLPRSALAEVCALDLIDATSEPGLDYLLVLAEVDSSEVDAMAVCLTELPRSDRPARDVAPTLVGYLDREHCTTADSVRALDAAGPTEADILVGSTTVALGSAGDARECDDADGLAPDSADIVALRELRSETVETVTIYNTVSDGFMALQPGDGGAGILANYLCAMPTGDADARYGRGWFYWGTMSLNYLYVCSEGYLRCSYSNAIMSGANNIIIRGNGLNNSIRLSNAVIEDQVDYDIARSCNAGYYRVFGWPGTWTSPMELQGQGGHNWLSGSLLDDFIVGGSGNDLLNGAEGDANEVYGGPGYDSLHGSGGYGICDGGTPVDDAECWSWVWPWPYSGQGDCCCSGCTVHRGCHYGDIGHGHPLGFVPW